MHKHILKRCRSAVTVTCNQETRTLFCTLIKFASFSNASVEDAEKSRSHHNVMKCVIHFLYHPNFLENNKQIFLNKNNNGSTKICFVLNLEVCYVET